LIVVAGAFVVNQRDSHQEPRGTSAAQRVTGGATALTFSTARLRCEF
jgi:hypothetical protein